MRSRRAALAALAVLPSPPAAAHMDLVGRALHLRVEPERIGVAVVTTMHAGADAQRLAQRFDESGDGHLDEAEADRLAAWLEADAFRGVSVTVGGIDVALAPADHALSIGEEHHRDLGDGISLRAMRAASLVSRPRPVSIALRAAPKSPREVLPVRLEFPAGWTIAAPEAEGGAVLGAAEAGNVGAIVTGAPGVVSVLATPPRVPLRQSPG
jgi:hypothetical protein